MVHAAIHWPKESDPGLWPFAMDYSAHLYNNTPNRTSKLSPNKLFARCTQPVSTLDHSRVWGCPAYVLNPNLQDGKELPKWNRRSRAGQFLGFSKDHASTVALIRNVTTGYVSPEFHILFDEEFNTVTADNINVTDALWESFNFTYTSYLPDDDDPLLVLQQETIPPPPFSPQGASQAPQGASQAPQGAGPAPQGAGIPTIKKEEVIAPPLLEEDEKNDGINDSDSDGNDDPPPAAPTARTQCRNRGSIRSSTATNGSTWRFTQLETRSDPDRS